MCILGLYFSPKVFQCFFPHLEKGKIEKGAIQKAIYFYIKMYTKFHRRINWTVMSPTPVPAAHLWHIHDLFFTLLYLPQLVMTEGFILTITWTTNSFWILVSCRRVLSVRSFPEKNHLWRDTSISSCSSSNFFSSAMVSAMLAVRRTSFPKGEVELTQIFLSR